MGSFRHVTLLVGLVLAALASCAVPVCDSAAFPGDLAGVECFGLVATPPAMGSQTAAACRQACCNAPDYKCLVWQWCADPTGAACGASAGGGCWTGGASATCGTKRAGWVGGQRKGVPTPAPTPAPPTPAGGPKVLTVPATDPAPVPLPFELGPSVSPSGRTIGVDSVGWKLDGERWFPRAGEIHLARVPASEWREQLLRMKAGGLDMVAVYVFWIHHEELEGKWTFGGRRAIGRFAELVKEIGGMKMMLRAGPWCHGEARNGGHPDWLLAKAKQDKFALRSDNPHYMGYVQTWYAQLAKQVQGLFWNGGGPIIAVQLDNETSDWRYLLALKAVALAVGMQPPAFAKVLP
jgi:hypothetical protein